MSAYRDNAIVVVTSASFHLEAYSRSFDTECIHCGQPNARRHGYCTGRRRWRLFGRLVCPCTPHFHRRCEGPYGCGYHWLEATKKSPAGGDVQ